MKDNIVISLGSIVDEAHKKAEEEVRSSVTRSVNAVVRRLMNDGLGYNQTEGLAHEIIRKRVEEYVLSDRFTKKIDEIIEASAEEQMTVAIKTLINHRTRKRLFEGE